jgi:hypothetical protein
VQGTPEDCTTSDGSHTARFLREFLRERSGQPGSLPSRQV